MAKFIFINTHPIQYNAPMYRSFVSSNLDFEVWYLSKGQLYDIGFGQNVVWDNDVINGYPYKWIKYNIGTGNVNSWFGLINLGLIGSIFRQRERCFIVFPAWMPLSFLIAAILGKLLGHKIVLRTETPLKQFLFEKSFSFPLKLIYAKLWTYLGSYFVYIGTQNYKFWAYLNVKEENLFQAGYAVDNDNFDISKYLTVDRNSIRSKYDFNPSTFVIVFSGKLIHKKRPLILISAIKKLISDNLDIGLLILGDGELKSEILDLIENEKNIHFLGFVNQSELPLYYYISDALCLPSGKGETWGLVANEALNFNLRLIVSDLVGCSDDLVYPDQGCIFKCDSLEDLILKIHIMYDNLINGGVVNGTPASFYENFSFHKYYLCLNTIVEYDNK
jgi:glycosyltransferase involved in cell wall biosynthesis